MVGFFTVPPAGGGSLTHQLYVSLVSSQMERVSKMCQNLSIWFPPKWKECPRCVTLKLGQYCLAQLSSHQEEAYIHLFEGLLSYLGLDKA